MLSTDKQWLLHSGERVVAHGPLVNITIASTLTALFTTAQLWVATTL